MYIQHTHTHTIIYKLSSIKLAGSCVAEETCGYLKHAVALNYHLIVDSATASQPL